MKIITKLRESSALIGQVAMKLTGFALTAPTVLDRAPDRSSRDGRNKAETRENGLRVRWAAFR
jgi:hypothetical protein